VRPTLACPMQPYMTMPRDRSRTTLRRDAVVQIRVLPPALSLGALRTFGLGVVGAALLLAALLATPFFVMLGGRHASAGQGGTSHVIPRR